MDDRKRTPDVLGQLMGGDPEERQQTAKAAKRQDAKPSNQQSAKTLRQRLATGGKTKATLYLSPETAYELELAKLELRKVLDPDNLKDVTKSSIAEAALSLALRGLEADGENSAIAKELDEAVRR